MVSCLHTVCSPLASCQRHNNTYPAKMLTQCSMSSRVTSLTSIITVLSSHGTLLYVCMWASSIDKLSWMTHHFLNQLGLLSLHHWQVANVISITGLLAALRASPTVLGKALPCVLAVVSIYGFGNARHQQASALDVGKDKSQHSFELYCKCEIMTSV